MGYRHWRWIALASVVVIAGKLATWLYYPVRVSVDFTYQQRPYHASFLTLMRSQFCDDCSWFVAWAPARHTISLALDDGSLVLASPHWPFSWDNKFGVYRSPAAWVWLNHPTAPDRILLGDGSRRMSPKNAQNFPLSVISATVEQLSAFYQLAAFISDEQPSAPDPVAASSVSGGSWTEDGQYFAAIEATPLTPQGTQEILRYNDWADLDGGCRVLYRTPNNIARDSRAPTPLDMSQKRSLQRRGNIWSVDAAPVQGPSILYPTGKPDRNFGSYRDRTRPAMALLNRSRPALTYLHDIEYEGKTCRIPEWPDDAYNAYIDFRDDQVFFIGTSLDWAIIRN